MAPYNNAPESGTRNGRPAGRGPGAGALVGGALFVGVIAVCALVISYHGIFQFAEYGGHDGSPLAHVFPATYTLLLLMAFWVSYMLRGARPRERLWVDVALIPVLILVAATAMLLANFGVLESVHQGIANVIVAVAPLAALLVAFLLWMTVRGHIRRRREPAAPRPKPSDDPTTVLHTPATSRPDPLVEPDEPDDEELASRLPRLGEDDEKDEDTGEAVAPEVAVSVPEDDPLPETEDLPFEETDTDTGESATVSVPTVPLPRRSRVGRNPIKRAAEKAPVVPGAAAPTREEPAPGPVPRSRPEPVTQGSELWALPADEGFVHEPLPGDPVTDEAEAPVVPAAPEPEREPAPAPEPAPVPQPDPGPVPEAAAPVEAASAESPEPVAPPEPPKPSEPAEEPIPDTSLWEPPEDDTGTSAVSDYVPPVWTPPEDDGPPPGAEEEFGTEPGPMPVLDHDTGPAVRAAFRFGDVPPGAARPDPESELAAEPEETHEPEPAGHFPEAEELPPAVEPEPERPRTERSTPMDKRPMVLKPPRRPMPDFVSGPPSQRVRSEPLPPQD